MQDFERLSDSDLAQRYVANDQHAAAELYKRYAWRLLVVARTCCGRAFASRFDPEDVVQAAFQDLFEWLRNHAHDPESNRDLWGLLVVLTRNQVRRLIEHHSASKRAVQRTCPTEIEGDPIPVLDPHSGEPISTMVVQEHLERFPESDRHVIELRLQGFDVREITEHTGRPRRTVERILQTFRDNVAELI